jgi:putative transcriptional regulator|nr:MAG TPA: putative transcriptional regulator [Caudoviricetes sp.]
MFIVKYISERKVRNLVYVRVKEILKEKKKTKYWFVKKMEGGYQALSHLIDNETTGIHFDTLEKLCNVLECEPGDILVLKKRKEKLKK